MPRPLGGALSGDAVWRLTTSVAYIVNIYGAHTWKQGALGAAGQA